MGLHIPEEQNPANQILNPEFVNAAFWDLDFGWSISAGKAHFSQTGPHIDTALQNTKILDLNTQYNIKYNISAIDFNPADILQLRLWNTLYPIPIEVGEKEVTVSSPAAGFPRLWFTTDLAFADGQSLALEYIFAYDTLAQDVVTFNLLGQTLGKYDHFQIDSTTAMNFYANKTDRTRVWIKHG